jgi:hypothetical protein
VPYLLVRHQVQDYERWKPLFDEHGLTRKANGSMGGQLFRSADNPNEIVMLIEVEELDRARQFAQSDDLRQAMQQAGVTDQPDIYFLEQAEVLAM